MQAEIFEKVAKVLFNPDVYDKILNGEKSHPKSISEIANIYSENKLDKSLKNDNVKNTLTKICNGIAEIIVTQSKKNSEKKGGAPRPNQRQQGRQQGRQMEGEALVLIVYGAFLALSVIVLSSLGLDYLTQNPTNPNVFSFRVDNLTYEEALLINILSFIIGIVLLVICLHYYRQYNRRNNLVIPYISSDSDEESQTVSSRQVSRNNVQPRVNVKELFERFRVTTREDNYIPESQTPSLTIGISPREVYQGEVSNTGFAIKIPLLDLTRLNQASSAWNPPSAQSVDTMSIAQPNDELNTNSQSPNTGRLSPSLSSVVSLLNNTITNPNRLPFESDDNTQHNLNRSLNNTPPSTDDLQPEVLSSRITSNPLTLRDSSLPTTRSIDDINTQVQNRQAGISFPNETEQRNRAERGPMFHDSEISIIPTEELDMSTIRSILNSVVGHFDNTIASHDGTGSTIASVDSVPSVHSWFFNEDDFIYPSSGDDEVNEGNTGKIVTMFTQAVTLIEEMFTDKDRDVDDRNVDDRNVNDLEVVDIEQHGGKRMRYRQSKTKKRSRKQKRTKRRGRNHRLRSRKNLRKTRK